MQAYRLAGGTGVLLRASAKQLLRGLCPRLASVPEHAHCFSGRTQTAASATGSLPSGDAAASNTLQEPGPEPDGDAADCGPGPGPGSLRDADQEPLPPGLYVIPTPIGNLRDITLRAADTLRRVNLLLAEDTRHTRKLLNFLPVGLVSDAGMPGISDPGHVVVAAAVAAGVRVVALPGPCAFVTALVGSGLPTDAFTFVGFLPPKSGARRTALERLASQPCTLVLYAPPHGLAGVLRDCVEVLGAGRRCCVARELSKLHEEYFRSTLEGALREFGEVREARGEICLLVEGCGPPPGQRTSSAGSAGVEGGIGAASGSGAVERVLRELLEAGTPVSGAVKEVVANLGANKKVAYATALRLSDELARKAGGATTTTAA